MPSQGLVLSGLPARSSLLRSRRLGYHPGNESFFGRMIRHVEAPWSMVSGTDISSLPDDPPEGADEQTPGADTALGADGLPYGIRDGERRTEGDTAVIKRRHQRITAPLDIIVDRRAWRAMDWSVTGFGLELAALPLEVGTRFTFHARFVLRGANMTMKMQAEVARRTDDRVGCRFVDLDPDQQDVLRLLHGAHRTGQQPSWRAVVGASLGGEGLSGDAGGAWTGSGDGVGRGNGEPGDGGRSGRRWPWSLPDAGLLGRRRRRRLVGIYLALVLGLCGLVAAGLGHLTRDVESLYAAVRVPTAEVIAPADGMVETVLAAPGDLAGPRTLLLRLRTADDSVTSVISPCACGVAAVTVAPGDSVHAGEVVARMARTGQGEAPVVVETLFPLDAAGLVAPGQAVTVRIAGMAGLRQGVIDPGGAEGRSAFPEALLSGTDGVRAFVRVSRADAAALAEGQPARVRLVRGLSSLWRPTPSADAPEAASLSAPPSAAPVGEQG